VIVFKVLRKEHLDIFPEGPLDDTLLCDRRVIVFKVLRKEHLDIFPEGPLDDTLLCDKI